MGLEDQCPSDSMPMIVSIMMRVHFLEIEDVVSAILFLLSEKSAMVNCENLMLDGGYHTC